MQVSVRRFLLMFLLGRGRLARRLGLARLRLRPWLRLLLRWSGGSVVFWCRGTRLVGLAGLRFGFNVLRRRRVLFRRIGRRSVVRLRRRPVIRGFVGLWDVRVLRRLVHIGRRSSLCGGRVIGLGSILGWPLLLLSVLRRMSDIGLLNRLLIVLRRTRNILWRTRLLLILWRTGDVLLATCLRVSLGRRLGVVCSVRSRPGWGWQAGSLGFRSV